MDSASLVKPPLEVGAAFLKKFQEYAPIAIAFWGREYDSDTWTLCVAPVTDEPFDRVYGEVLRIESALRAPEFERFRVRLLYLDEPVVHEMRRIYQAHAGKVPLHVGEEEVGEFGFEEACLASGPRGEFEMPTGRETLHHIVDQEAEFFRRTGSVPKKIKLPVLMAYDLAKCGRDDLGDLSGRIFKDGITVLEEEGFHGMDVEIVRDSSATLEFE